MFEINSVELFVTVEICLETEFFFLFFSFLFYVCLCRFRWIETQFVGSHAIYPLEHCAQIIIAIELVYEVLFLDFDSTEKEKQIIDLDCVMDQWLWQATVVFDHKTVTIFHPK